jgi:hypothetical protein
MVLIIGAMCVTGAKNGLIISALLFPPDHPPHFILIEGAEQGRNRDALIGLPPLTIFSSIKVPPLLAIADRDQGRGRSTCDRASACISANRT